MQGIVEVLSAHGLNVNSSPLHPSKTNNADRVEDAPSVLAKRSPANRHSLNQPTVRNGIRASRRIATSQGHDKAKMLWLWVRTT
jgi:hypothetical protein